MRPQMDEVRVKYAVDLLNKNLDASKEEIREALTNEAHYYRKEPEKAGDLRINDLE